MEGDVLEVLAAVDEGEGRSVRDEGGGVTVAVEGVGFVAGDV